MAILRYRLLQAAGFFSKENSFGLKELSKELSSDSLIHDEKLLCEASVACYSLSKILEKRYLTQGKAWPGFKKRIFALLNSCCEKEDHDSVHKLLGEIELLNRQFGKFVVGVIEKGRLKAAANIYAHGASLGKAVELSGAEKSNAASYIGMTRIPDKYETIPLRQRLSDARRMF